MSETNLTVGRIGDLSPKGDQADGLREIVAQQKRETMTSAFIHRATPDFRIFVGIKDDGVVEVDWMSSLTSGALSTPPTVEQVKQWLEDAVKFLEGK